MMRSKTTVATTVLSTNDIAIIQRNKPLLISITIVVSIIILFYHIYIPHRLNLNPDIGSISINSNVWQHRGNGSIGGMGFNITSLPQREKKYLSSIFPRIVHQMWKDSSIPSELKRWKDGCQALSSEYEFRMYHDDGIKAFVSEHYPQYQALFNTLHGVYMADMARILLTYHYGGLYIDLDFYCHRPLHCLELSLPNDILLSPKKNILVVSLEPVVHANLFRNKTRIVIQDFMMATPKHPFFKWFLDDRNAVYQQQNSTASTYTKGPFSYAIENDIDKYKMITNTYKSKSNSSVVIYEFKEEVLHSLVDATNSRLKTSCSNPDTAGRYPKSCEFVNEDLFFRPSDNTVAVHMWSHVHLGWHFLRFAYLANVYNQVERALPPTFRCPPDAEKRAKERSMPKPPPLKPVKDKSKEKEKKKKVPQTKSNDQKTDQKIQQKEQKVQQQPIKGPRNNNNNNNKPPIPANVPQQQNPGGRPAFQENPVRRLR